MRSPWCLALGMALALAPAVRAENQQGFLGILGEDADGDQRGAVVRELVPDGPAAKAGLKPGDVIVAVDEAKVEGFAQLAETMKSHAAGSEMTFKILRDGKEERIRVTLGERQPDAVRPPRDFRPGGRGFRFRVPNDGQPFEFEFPKEFVEQFKFESRPMMGVHLQPIDQSLRDRLKLGDVQGLLVADVAPNGPAAKAGVKSEDLITEADGKPVTEPKTLTDLVASKKVGDTIALKVRRGEETIELKVALESMSPSFGMAQRFSNQMPVSPEEGWPWSLPMKPFEERVEKMRNRIDQLEKRIDELTKELSELRSKTAETSKEPKSN